MIEYVIRWRTALFVVGILSLAVAYPLSTRLETERSVASLFGDDDPTINQYRQFKQWFGRNDVLVLMYRDEALASSEGIERSRVLTERVNAIEGVRATLSPWVLDRAANGMSPDSILPFSLGTVKTNDRPKLMRADDPVGSGLSKIFAGYTHSTDYSHGAVVAMIDDSPGTETVPTLNQVAKDWASQPGISNVSLVGEPVLVEAAFGLVRRDGSRLAIVTVGLLSLVVTLSLVDLRLVMLLALMIGWSVVVTKAAMYASGIELSLIASILTAIVTVIAVTAVLHLGVRYHSRRGRGFSQADSAADVMRHLSAPVFWTCATDAAGFAALWFSEILPVRQFGLMVAMASIGVFVAMLFFAPALLMVPELGFARHVTPIRRSITRMLRRICVRLATGFVGKKPLTIGISLLLMSVAVAVVTRGETETSFLKNFRRDSSIVTDYGNVEDNLGGAGVWDLVLDVPAAVTNDFLDGVLELEAELLRECGGDEGLSKAISLADATEVLGRSTAGKLMPAELRIAAMRLRLPTFIGALISDPEAASPDRRKLRIMLRSAEGLSADQKRSLIERVNAIAGKYASQWREGRARDDAGAADDVIVTGYYVLMTRLVDQLVSDQWRCFAASAGLIWLLMCLATRSLPLATAALVPNLLPAFLVLGFVSAAGGRINMGAAMIAAVSVGLSIDGSVHLLTAYRRRRRLGRSRRQSAVSAAGNIGAAVMLATVALVVGFSVLSTSEFVPTATFGTLVAWTLVIGTVINLSVLPALVSGGKK